VSGGLAAVHQRAVLAGHLLSVHCELTFRCNAACGHCYQASRSAEGELTLEEWLDALGQIREAGALVVSFSGGEPLLSPHFWPIAERARQLGMAFRVLTNGTLLDAQVVPRLAQLHPLSIEVSIFSSRPEVHDAVTGVPGSFGRSIRGLLRLRRAGVPIVLKCPLLATSASDHALVLRLGERLGAGVVIDPQISPRADGQLGPIRCRGDDAELSTALAHPAHAGTLRLAPPLPGQAPPCGMGRSFAVLSPGGDVFACPLHRVSAGNVRATPLRAIWTDSPLLQQLRARQVGALRVCGTCPKNGYCGRCSAVALLEDGDLDGPSSRACHIAELIERAREAAAPGGHAQPDASSLPALPQEG
jgi:radical SAM protein with 4Fe4S-binding SPASM domain